MQAGLYIEYRGMVVQLSGLTEDIFVRGPAWGNLSLNNIHPLLFKFLQAYPLYFVAFILHALLDVLSLIARRPPLLCWVGSKSTNGVHDREQFALGALSTYISMI